MFSSVTTTRSPGQIAQAREVLEKALAQSPDVETLKQRLAELDGFARKAAKEREVALGTVPALYS